MGPFSFMNTIFPPSEIIRPYKCFPHVSKILTLTYLGKKHCCKEHLVLLLNIFFFIFISIYFLLYKSNHMYNTRSMKETLYHSLFSSIDNCLNNLYLSVWWCLTPHSTILQLYRGVQFFGWRKPPTCHKSLTNFIT